MNLIEQLGGYEKAKRELQLKEQNSVLQCCIAVTAEMIRDALLEYRRQHNIFEVLDLIMYENKLYEIKYIYHAEKARITDGLQGRTVYDFPRGIRHATPEEIKAGKRL